MRIICVCTMLAALLAITGCANPYKTFYTPVAAGTQGTDYITCPEPEIRRTNDDFQKTLLTMYSKGYTFIGYSSFNSGGASDKQLIKQAKEIQACFVLLHTKYTHTETGYIPITDFNPGTQITVGNTTVQTPGYTTTSYVPHQERRFDFNASFFAKLPPTILGIYRDKIPDALRIKYNIEKGIIIRAVREGYPADTAGFIPGDIVIGYGGTGFVSDADFMKFLDDNQGNEAEFTIRRADKELKKVVVLGKKPQ